MAKKKVIKPADSKKLEETGYFFGYDVTWMKNLEGEHPDYDKVMKAARKAKYIK